ncbi:MAG: response regulator [Magnetovibrio sp.]|nr:response regulator [Magnetovibrio sp.]
MTSSTAGQLTAYDLRELSVLIIDDNQHMRYLVRQLLFAFGIKKTFEAEDGATALQALQNFEADLAICDWHMAPLDGIEFTRMTRRSDDTANPFLPIIMLTGHTELHRVEEARDAGVDEFLSKPISASKLYSRIVKIIEKRRPFVRSPIYLGPDRRRRSHNPAFRGEERRQDMLDDEGPAPGNLFAKTVMPSHHAP